MKNTLLIVLAAMILTSCGGLTSQKNTSSATTTPLPTSQRTLENGGTGDLSREKWEVEKNELIDK